MLYCRKFFYIFVPMNIKPFRAFRPRRELAAKIASRPYDVLNTEEARMEAKENDYSFLRIVRSEIDLPPDTDVYDQKVYEKARENLENFIKEGWLFQDAEPFYYVYKQEMNGHSQYGLVTSIAVEDYWSGKIKIHELTREKKEKDRINHVKTTRTNTGPVFLTYNARQEINDIIAAQVANPPEYDFVDDFNVRHTAWIIRERETIDQITEIFHKINVVYVADGHHRSKSAAETGKQLKAENPHHTGEEDYNYFLCVLFPHDQLKIMDYNRVINHLNGNTPREILDILGKQFSIVKVNSAEEAKPDAANTFGMYLEKQWYLLSLLDTVPIPRDPVESLDVSLLQDLVLKPVFGITDPRTDEGIDFVGGIRGLQELQKRVGSGEMKVAFALHPVSIRQLMDIADAGKIMPPKSTWFEPKLRSGIFVRRF